MSEPITLIGLPFAIEGLEISVKAEMGSASLAGLVAVGWSGAHRLVCSFRVDPDGVSVEVPTETQVIGSATFGTEALRSALTSQLADDVPPLELPGGLLGLFRDLAISGIGPGRPGSAYKAFRALADDRREIAVRAIAAELEGGRFVGDLDALEPSELAPWWHLFEGTALEVRLLLAPPFHPMPDAHHIQLLLIGAPGSRAALVPLGDGRVVVGRGHDVVDRFVEAVDAVSEAIS